MTVTELDPLQVEDRLRVGQDEGVEGQDFEHLEGGDQGAPALLDHMGHAADGGALGGEGGGDGGVAKLDHLTNNNSSRSLSQLFYADISFLV